MSACLAIKVVALALLPVWAWLLVHTYHSAEWRGGFVAQMMAITVSVAGFAVLAMLTCSGKLVCP